MFVPDCPPAAAALLDRLHSRDVVIRNLFALAAGVRRTLCWNLGPETPDLPVTYEVMGFLFDRLRLMDYQDGELTHRYPAADTLELTAWMLRDATAVRRREVPDQPDLFVFEVERPDRQPLLVAWVRRPAVTGEDSPPVDFQWPWPAESAYGIDAHGKPLSPQVDHDRIHFPLTVVPVFLSANPVD